MRRLLPTTEDRHRIMRSEYIAEILNQPSHVLISNIAARIDSQHLELNVIHTDPRATATLKPSEPVLPRSLRALLQTIETKLRVAHHSSLGPAFAIEASITSASFRRAEETALQITTAGPGSNQPHITR
jgi:hypothetical protein